MSEEQQHPQQPAEGGDEDVEASGAERVEEEVEKKPLAEGAGPVEAGRDREATDQEERRQETANHSEGRKEEDKGLLDKVKDKLKGE